MCNQYTTYRQTSLNDNIFEISGRLMQILNEDQVCYLCYVD